MIRVLQQHPHAFADALTSYFSVSSSSKRQSGLSFLRSWESTPCEELDLVFDRLDRQPADTYRLLAEHNDGPLR